MVFRSQFDFNHLASVVDKKHFKLAEVQDKLVKVAFDVFRMSDRDPDELWQVQSADDGEFIVARYNDEEAETIKTASTKEKTETPWHTILAGDTISFWYKDDPVVKLAAKQLGIEQDQLHLIQSFLPIRLATDKNLVLALLDEMNEEARCQLVKLHPELTK